MSVSLCFSQMATIRRLGEPHHPRHFPSRVHGGDGVIPPFPGGGQGSASPAFSSSRLQEAPGTWNPRLRWRWNMHLRLCREGGGGACVLHRSSEDQGDPVLGAVRRPPVWGAEGRMGGWQREQAAGAEQRAELGTPAWEGEAPGTESLWPDALHWECQEGPGARRSCDDTAQVHTPAPNLNIFLSTP